MDVPPTRPSSTGSRLGPAERMGNDWGGEGAWQLCPAQSRGTSEHRRRWWSLAPNRAYRAEVPFLPACVKGTPVADKVQWLAMHLGVHRRRYQLTWVAVFVVLLTCTSVFQSACLRAIRRLLFCAGLACT